MGNVAPHIGLAFQRFGPLGMPVMTIRTPVRAATALATTLALALPPLPLFAQEASSEELMQRCVDGGIAAADASAMETCMTGFQNGEDGVAAVLNGETADEVEAETEAEAEAEPEAEVEAEAAPEADPETEAAPEADVEAEGGTGTEVETEAETEAEAGAETETEAEAEAEAEDASADEAEVVEPAATDEAADAPEADATAQAEAPAEEPAAEDGAVAQTGDATDDAAVEAAPTETVETAEPETEDGSAAEDSVAVDGGTDADGTAAAEAPEDVDADTDAAETQTEAEAVETVEGTQAPVAVDGGTDAQATVVDDGAGEDQPQTVAAGSSDDAEPESEIGTQVQEVDLGDLDEDSQRRINQLADVFFGDGSDADDTGAAGTVAATSDDGTVGEVVEADVAEEDTRKADEEFATSAIVTERSARRDEQSTFERFAPALAGLAVGALIGNQLRVVSNSGDRVIVQQQDGGLQLLKDDDVLLRQAGSNVRTENFDDGSSRTLVTREDGSQVITVRDASLRVLRRVVRYPDGTEYTLIDDTQAVEPVDVATLPDFAPAVTRTGADPLGNALAREAGVDRRFTLSQVRSIPEVRSLAPAIEVDSVTFESGSAAIQPDQADELTDLARSMRRSIQENPRAVFLIEGHTDATGDAALNLALSDRRAESLALALNEYFEVPVENMVVQGYGERFLKVPTQVAERANRRAVAREITGLLQTAAAN